MTAPTQVSVPLGVVCTTTWGLITHQTHHCLSEMRSHVEAGGLKLPWIEVPGNLVDRARNQAVVQMLQMQPPMGWILFVDGDAVFAPDALSKLLMTAYHTHPHADVVGGYCTLRGEPYLPTIDTGTGTWESVLPGQGVMEVMRTGSAFILLKRHVFEKVPGPWYGTRNPWRPIDALAEVDNYAHIKFDGKNPLAKYPEWQTLVQCAKDDPSSRVPPDPAAFVGEDSGFCDRGMFHGARIVVNTDVEVHHVDTVVRSAADHKRLMDDRNRLIRKFVGAQK